MSKEFRFAIGSTVPLSEIWTVSVRRSDVYVIAAHPMNGAMKLSLHGSGVCQFALFQDFYDRYVAHSPSPTKSRTILRWTRSATPAWGGLCAATIHLSSCEHWEEPSPPSSSKKLVRLIPPPPDGWAVEVNFFYSAEDPDLQLSEGEPLLFVLSKFQLASGEFLTLIAGLARLPSDFFAFKPAPTAHAILSFGPDEDHDDQVGNVLFIVQDRVGSATIYSMHNMRLVRVPKDHTLT